MKQIVLGDPGSALPGTDVSGCAFVYDGSPTVNKNRGAGSMASVSGHKLVETVTDFAVAWHFNLTSSGDSETTVECAGLRMAVRQP